MKRSTVTGGWKMRFSTLVLLLMLGSSCAPYPSAPSPTIEMDISGRWEGTAGIGPVGFSSSTPTHTATFTFIQSGSSVTGTWTMTLLADPGAMISGTLSGQLVAHFPTSADLRGDLIELDLVSACSPGTTAHVSGEFRRSLQAVFLNSSLGFVSTVNQCRSGGLGVDLKTRRP